MNLPTTFQRPRLLRLLITECDDVREMTKVTMVPSTITRIIITISIAIKKVRTLTTAHYIVSKVQSITDWAIMYWCGRKHYIKLRKPASTSPTVPSAPTDTAITTTLGTHTSAALVVAYDKLTVMKIPTPTITHLRTSGCPHIYWVEHASSSSQMKDGNATKGSFPPVPPDPAPSSATPASNASADTYEPYPDAGATVSCLY